MIFGSGSAKFERSGSEVLLEYSNIRQSWFERQINTRVSVYDHYTSYEFPFNYAEFWVDVELSKYANPTAKYQELYPDYLYGYVHFAPHADGKYISGSDGKPVVFFIKEFKHSYESDTVMQYNKLSLLFTSTTAVELTGSIK